MFEKMISFLKEAIRLKKITRSGWLYSGVSKSDVESVADHSYSVILIALLISLREEEKGAKPDLEKILIMALLHDLSESVSQDINRCVRKFSPENFDVFKNELDSKATKYLMNKLPLEIRTKLLEIYNEFQQNNSFEAKIVSCADRIETMLQMKEYEKIGYPKRIFTEFLENFRAEIDNYEIIFAQELAKKILEED